MILFQVGESVTSCFGEKQIKGQRFFLNSGSWTFS